MKKLSKKLKLNKETISALNNEQMSNVKGGQSDFLCKPSLDPLDCETTPDGGCGGGGTGGTGGGGGGRDSIDYPALCQFPVAQ